MHNFFNAFICLLLGMILSFSQSPYDYWFLIFPVFSGLYLIYTKFDSKKWVFISSFLFGIGYFVAGLNWIGNALLVEGNEYKWVWPLAVIALPTALSLFTALSVTVAHIVSAKKTAIGFVVFCSCLALSEFIRGYVFTGFPWNLYGYTWLGLFPVAQISALVGPYGLTYFTIIWGAVFGYLFLNKRKALAVVIPVLLSFFLAYGFGQVRLLNKNNLDVLDTKVGVVQPNIEQATKWKPEELAKNFQTHVDLSKGLDGRQKIIYVWPETAIPPSILNSIAAKEQFQTFLKSDNSILISGALSALPNTQTRRIEYFNAVFSFDGKNAPVKLYDKSHLVPFGEYIPFQKYIPLSPVVSFTGFQRGDGPETIDLSDFPSFSPQVCYEIIFPNRAINKFSERPEFILVVTNDAWYGDSAGPRQHFASARFRAIEQGISVVRSANTGISGVIDPYGRIVNMLDINQRGIIDVYIPQAIENKTLYSFLGDIIFFFSAIFGVLFGFFYRKIDF